MSLKEDIEKAEQALLKLKQAYDNEQRTLRDNPEHWVGEQLHSLQCRSSHEDQCGWFYEIRDGVHDWNGSTHGCYLTNAKIFVVKCKDHNITPENAIDLVRAARLY